MLKNIDKNNGKIEILAPVGALDMVGAAVYCGANAIYLGFSGLNARAKTNDFSKKEFKEIIDFCHERDVLVYLTLNTIVFDKEFLEAKSIIMTAAELGVDAIIVQDLGIFRLIKKICKEMPVHGSTQMSVGSLLGVQKLEEMGFKRVVLARELSKKEIKEIVNNTNIEVEVFVQGAHCMSVSGQCYLSSFVGGRSGNRGLCAQPCRLPFSSRKNQKDYNLSLKDLSLIRNVKELEEIGVTSVKIEGRMKRPEYVAAAVTACVAAKNNTDLEVPIESLEKVFSRSGFTDGFYKGKILPDMFGTRVKSDVQDTYKVLKSLGNLYHKQTPLVPISFSYTQKENTPISLTVNDGGGLNGRVNEVTVIGEIPQIAINNPTDDLFAFKSLEKLGSTPFYTDFENCTFNIDNTLMVRMSQLNNLRRIAIETLLEKRKEGFQKSFSNYIIPENPSFTDYRKPKIRARLQKIYQIPTTKSHLDILEHISLPAREMVENLDYILDNFSDIKDKFIIEPPRVVFYGEELLLERLLILKEYGFLNLEISNLSHLKMAENLKMNMFGGFSLNIFNTMSLEEHRGLGLKDTNLSLELDFKNIRALDHNIMKIGKVVHGFLPVMTTRNCPGRAIDSCGECKKSLKMYDRIGNEYLISCENFDNKSFSEIYNPHILYMGNRLRDINCLDFITLYFTKEDEKEIKKVIENYHEDTGSLGYDQLTRGLFYKEIL